ncbi:MAG: hypothetical protein ACREN2_05305 [Candidatus Dormibacteria bacterium]
MPWTMLLRAIVRIAASMFMWRMATARRGAQSAGQAQGGGAPRAESPGYINAREAAVRLRYAASLGWRLFSAAVFLTATALLTSGGVTLTVLSPRWLGIALLVLAALTLSATIAELVTVRRLLGYRRFRRHAESLKREVS